MGHILDALIGLLVGMLITRGLMAPSFCPDCLQRKRWEAALKQELQQRSPEDKSQSRKFYQLRKKDKEENKEC